MWTVSLTSANNDAAQEVAAANEFNEAPGDGETFVRATLTITADGAAATEQGFDLANEGANPWANLSFVYVSTDGQSFDGSTGAFCAPPNPIWNQGAVFSDGAAVVGDICVAVPSDKVDGGLWRISNSNNDSVWLATS